ncbi:hypothetical protein FACS1894201_03150 [Bacteroidia bacterium]|nr:hypothetical protein FACS1894201_03150 [Bacteroidia bacterium]
MNVGIPASKAEVSGFQGLMVNRMMMEDKTLLGIHAGVILPLGEYGEARKLGIGGGLRAKYFGTNTMAFSFNVGMYNLTIKDATLQIMQNFVFGGELEDYKRRLLVPDDVQINAVTGSSRYIPCNVGVEYYFPKYAAKKFRPYIGLGIGLNALSTYYTVEYNVPFNSRLQQMQNEVQSSKTHTTIGVTPSVGFLATLNELWNINAEVNYNYFLIGDQKGSSLKVSLGVVLDIGFKYVR